MRTNPTTSTTTALAAAALIALAAAARGEDAPKPAAPPAPIPSTSRFFDTYDANQDGKVTKEEFTGDPDTFSLLDKDGDGVIAPTELGLPADYKPRPLPKPADEPAPGAGRGGGVQERMERFKRQLAEWDTDKDGKVTKEEYKGRLPFDVLDRNKDGMLSADDIRGAGAGRPGGAPPGGGAGGRPDFKSLDKNADGKVTQDEFPGPAERFQAIDANKDGAVTLEEMEAAAKAGPPGVPGARMFQRFDKNGDGKVARDEFPGNDESFKAMDRNADGFVTTDEVDALRARGGPPGSPPPPGQPGTTPGEPGMAGGEMGPPPREAAPGGLGSALFAALDRDRDGKLSRAELPVTDEEWRRLDRDANGWITPEEAK